MPESQKAAPSWFKPLIASRLRQLRARDRLTQEDVGRQIDFGSSTVATWEDERLSSVPNAVAVMRLAELFQVSADWLVCRDGDPSAPGSRWLVDRPVFDLQLASRSLHDRCWDHVTPLVEIGSESVVCSESASLQWLARWEAHAAEVCGKIRGRA